MNWRKSDCVDLAERGLYTLAFPHTNDPADGGYGWEVNVESWSGFIAINSQGKVKIPINNGHDRKLAKTTEEIEEGLFVDPAYRQRFSALCCALGDVPTLESLCRHYPDDELVGFVDVHGNTGSLSTATEDKGSETLQSLHERGDSITLADHYGRTPLLETAQRGRFETDQYLAQQSVDLEARDGNGKRKRAVEIAADTEQGTKEGIKRLRTETYRVAIEADTPPAPSPTGTSASSRPRSGAFFKRKHDGTLEIHRPQILLQPPSRQHGQIQLQKAFATLDRGSN